MKTSTLIAAVATLFAAAGASAQQATYELPQPVSSTVTRAAVVADLERARAAGTLQLTEWDRQAATPTASTRSRSDVQSEARAAAANGSILALVGEPQGFDVQPAKGAANAAALVAAVR